MADADKILKRFKVAENRKTNWSTRYQEVLEYTSPVRDNFTERAKGQARDGAGLVFDSTATKGLQKFASNLQTSLVPPFTKWIELEPGVAVEDEGKQEAAKTLQGINDTMFAHIGNSNFDTQIAEAFMDLGIGTGALLVQKGTQGRALHFSCVPMHQLYLAEGANGSVGSVYRKHPVQGGLIKETWDDAVLPDTLMETIKDKPEKEISLIESTIPARVTVPARDGSGPIEVDGFLYTVIDEKSKAVLVERETRSSPWVVFRYSVVPGEVYGRGPAMSVFHDIKTINKTKELILKNASLAIAGAYTVADDGVINTSNIRIRPGALIPVASNPGGSQGPTIAALPRSGDFNVGQLILEDMRNSINDEFLANPLGPVDSPVRTATEVSLRQQELANRIGSAFGRLQFELIAPIINRILFLLDEQGIIDLGGFIVDGNVIQIQHKSPLAAAQNAREFQANQSLAEVMMANFGPQIAALVINPMKFAEVSAELLGSNLDIVNSKEQQEQIQQTVAQILAAQQQQGGEQQ